MSTGLESQRRSVYNVVNVKESQSQNELLT